MKKITMLDADKSKLYDKFIKYLKDKGYTTPIPTTVTDEIKALGIDTDAELAEILDAMLERNIVSKGLGETEPKFVITESELETLSKETEDLQNFVVTNDKLTDIKKIKEEYKAKYVKYYTALSKKQFDMLTKFEMQDLKDLPDFPESEFLEETEKDEVQKEAQAEVDATLNSAFVAIMNETHGDFDWKKLVESVIDFKETMSTNKEFIKKIEKDCKDGKLDTRKISNLYEFKRIERFNTEIQNHLRKIAGFQDIAAKYGITIIENPDKLSISSTSIPELKFEQALLSKELQSKITKTTETAKFGDMDTPEALSQEEFKKIIQRQKILLKDSEPDQADCLEDIQEIITKAEGTTDKTETTSMVLSMNDDGELKYYKVTVLKTDLDAFKSLVSKCKSINESDAMVPTPVPYDKDKMNVPDYEKYLMRFYKTYGLDKDYVPTKNPLVDKRAPYPHESTGVGHTYYETIYSAYLKEYKVPTRAENNDVILDLLNKSKESPSMEDELKTKIDELIALLTIDDLEAKKAAGKIKHGIGFVYEEGKLPDIKAKLAEVDPLGKFVPIVAVPVPRERGESETIEDYEKYLLEHYKTHLPSIAPTKDPLKEEIRKPYPHELKTFDKDGKLSLTEPLEEGYYKKFYHPYAESLGLKEKRTLTGKKPFGGRRKVTGREAGLELDGIKEAFKKLGEKLKIFDESFTEEKSKNILELIKRVLKVLLCIAAVVILLHFVAPGLLPWNFFPIIARWIGKLGTLGPLSATRKAHIIAKLVMALTAAIGLIIAIAYGKYKGYFKRRKYPGPDSRGEGPHTGDGPGGGEEPPEPPKVEDIEKLLGEGADYESILSSIIAKYAEAKHDYKVAEELASDPEHATEETKADRDTKRDIKDKRKEDLVDTILIGLAYVEPAEMTEEIGGMTL